MKRYWAIVGGTFVVPLTEISSVEMNDIKSNPKQYSVSAIPVYWSDGLGVWPHPDSLSNKCIVVQEVKEEEI